MSEIKSIGLCPVCKKGHMVEGSLGYSCNYFKSMDDKCKFNIYHTYFGKVITEEIALQLLEKGETDVFNDLQKKDGTVFSAKLAIIDGMVKPVFSNKILEHHCPACGGNVEELLTGYACENYNKHDDSGYRKCNLFIPKVIASREIPPQAAEILLQGKETPFMTGFRAKSGDEFTSRLVLQKDLSVSFSNNICKCPKCGGNIYVGKKAYNCSNYRNENIKCDFVIWREMLGRQITIEEAVELIENKETKLLSGFHDKEGNLIERKLILNEELKVKLV